MYQVNLAKVFLFLHFSFRSQAITILIVLLYFRRSIILIMFENDQLEEPDYDKILQLQDFFPKIFLQPSEIRLDKEAGLKVIKRHNNHPDKFDEEDVKPILIDENQINKFTINPQRDDFGRTEHPAGHGLLSLFKRTKERHIKLAICICVYSESKHMLKTTIKGIQESNKDFLSKAGIMSHEIIVIVIFDGIEHLNSSRDQTENMISFFNEIDIKNGFRQRSNSMALDEFLKEVEQNKFDINAINDQRMGQINLFTEEELQDLKPKLFQNQYEQYVKTKKLLSDIKSLILEKELKLDSLPNDVVKKYEDLCVNFCAENNYWFETQEEIQQYLNTRKNIKYKLIYDALSQVQDLCNRYLQSRQDKIILYPVRMEKDYLRNPREAQNMQQEFSSLIDESERKEYNYLFLCVKHKNSGKLNSHMVFFEGFCKIFDPDYCMLTDVGVKPEGDAIFKMYKHMQLNPKCGGVCGYMSLKIQNPSDDLGYRQDGYNEDEVDCFTRTFNYIVSVQRAQQFEYHYAHMLDKPFESCFNYIHVLPGAFSGYRWKALKSISYQPPQKHSKRLEDGNLELESERYTNNSELSDAEDVSETLLKRYLKTAFSDNVDLSLENSNMYLAEDRILCLGIHALDYDLHYLPDAESSVDPVTSLTKLLGQRRRWINGSWFAFNYVRQHSYESSSCFFMFQLFYYSFVQKLQWIGPTLFYLAMNLTLISFVTNNVVPAIEEFFKLKENFQLYNYNILYIFNIKQMLLSIPDIVNFAYILSILSVVLWSCMVNNNEKRFKTIYYGASTLIGIYGILVLGLLVYNTYSIIQQTTQTPIGTQEQFLIPLIYLRALILFVIAGFALPILWSFSFKKTVEMITSLLSYIYYTPTYINILQIFAFCRIDDLSWGTKGLDNEKKTQMMNEWGKKKFVFVLQYVSTNVVISYLLITLSKFDLTKNIIILVSSALVVFLLSFRLIFAAIYLLKYYLTRSCQKLSTQYINDNRTRGYKVYNALRLIELKIKEVEKERTKRKKHEEFKTLASATSIILSKALSNFGKKIRNKVAKHIVHNNLIPRKDLLDPFKKRLKNKRKIGNKRSTEIHTIEEVEEKSDSQDRKIVTQIYRDEKQEINKKIENEHQSDKREIKNILKSIRQRYKSKIKSVNK